MDYDTARYETHRTQGHKEHAGILPGGCVVPPGEEPKSYFDSDYYKGKGRDPPRSEPEPGSFCGTTGLMKEQWMRRCKATMTAHYGSCMTKRECADPCSYCGRSRGAVIECTGCKSVSYCSMQCREEHYLTGDHKSMCGVLLRVRTRKRVTKRELRMLVVGSPLAETAEAMEMHGIADETSAERVGVDFDLGTEYSDEEESDGDDDGDDDGEVLPHDGLDAEIGELIGGNGLGLGLGLGLLGGLGMGMGMMLWPGYGWRNYGWYPPYYSGHHYGYGRRMGRMRRGGMQKGGKGGRKGGRRGGGGGRRHR